MSGKRRTVLCGYRSQVLNEREKVLVKIRSIGVAGLCGATPKGGWSSEIGPADVVHTLVAVHTDEGVTGIGSAFTTESLVRAAMDVLAPHCVGASALEPERVSEHLHQSTFWLGRGGTITHAISAIDIALWDILGQVTGQPVGRLLGGRHRERVMPYASMLADTISSTVERIQELQDARFGAFKLGWGPIGKRGSGFDEALVAAARDTIGPDGLLMVDAGASDTFWANGYKWALRTSHMLANYGVAWFEEPLRPDSFEDYVALRERSSVPIAGGEVFTRRQSFEPWLKRSAFDIVQPDVTKVGGLSEARKIGWMADACGTKLIAHGWNTAIGLGADLQLASALPMTDLVEYLVGSPYIDGIVEKPPALDDAGTIAIPDSPGLGVQIDWENLARFTDVRLLSIDSPLAGLAGERQSLPDEEAIVEPVSVRHSPDGDSW